MISQVTEVESSLESWNPRVILLHGKILSLIFKENLLKCVVKVRTSLEGEGENVTVYFLVPALGAAIRVACTHLVW